MPPAAAAAGQAAAAGGPAGQQGQQRQQGGFVQVRGGHAAAVCADGLVLGAGPCCGRWALGWPRSSSQPVAVLPAACSLQGLMRMLMMYYM